MNAPIPRAVLIALVVSVIPTQRLASQSGQCPAEAKCGIKDTDPPPSLSGTGGQGKDYQFEHTADVNHTGGGKMRTTRYEHAIRNTHSDRVLDVEWDDGNIAFQRIQPNCCVRSLRESCIAPMEKPNSVIKYGQAKQFSEKVSAYIPEAKTKTIPLDEIHPLESHIFGNLLWKGEKLTMNVGFRTNVTSDLAFVYTVTSQSSRQLLFRITSLTARWRQYNTLADALGPSGWRRQDQNDDVFRLERNQPATLTIRASGISRVVEEGAELQIYAEDKTEIAKAVVSVHLPALVVPVTR